jgi:hypothetical protein
MYLGSAYCQWNPQENREAQVSDELHKAEWYYVADRENQVWFLCQRCASLNRFRSHRNVGKIMDQYDIWFMSWRHY